MRNSSLLEKSFWKFPLDYWYKQLHSSANGLTEDAVLELAKLHKVPLKKQSRLAKDILLFLGQFTNPLMLLLIAAVVLSAFLGENSDVAIIGFIVASTGLMSFFQERHAGRVVEKLQSIIARKSTVLRDGKPVEIFAAQMVPGDILLFKAGDIVSADCLVVEANELHANEASLTGESYPVRKIPGMLEEQTPLAKRSNCLWEGSNIVSGTGKGLAILTGSNTLFGEIAKSASATTETAFERGIKRFGYFLMSVTLVLSLFILVVNLLLHRPVVDSALFALALAVGMAPELLPAITTIAMSAGANRMLQKKVIVKKLASIQNLGETNLLCTDKTGTITEGAIKVSSIVDAEQKESEFTRQLAFLNASFESGYENPIDEALKKLDVKLDFSPQKIGEVPFDFIRKRLSIAVDTGKEKLLITKGAAKNILDISTHVSVRDGEKNISDYSSDLNDQLVAYSKQGFRVLGVCYKNVSSASISKDDENEMVFAGFVLLADPVKEGIVEVIRDLNRLQVGIKIITGDSRGVAQTIGGSIGIAQPVMLTGDELDSIAPEALKQKVKDIHIFAEVEPHHKERIITALKSSYAVAYMGDGINDVAAINAADVGISVENAVDVAREAADFVLMEKDLRVLVDGIREGRKTFTNTLKYIFINTGSTFGNMFSVAVASLLLPFLPMLPKQILLTNFLTDFPFLSVASDNVDEEAIDRPGRWNLKLIREYMIYFGLHSSLFDLITFLTLLFILHAQENIFQTGWFIESVMTEIFILLIIRTRHSFIKSRPGKYLFWLCVAAILITVSLPYLPFASDLGLSPLSLMTLGAMLGIVLLYIITADLLKIWFFKRF